MQEQKYIPLADPYFFHSNQYQIRFILDHSSFIVVAYMRVDHPNMAASGLPWQHPQLCGLKYVLYVVFISDKLD